MISQKNVELFSNMCSINIKMSVSTRQKLDDCAIIKKMLGKRVRNVLGYCSLGFNLKDKLLKYQSKIYLY